MDPENAERKRAASYQATDQPEQARESVARVRAINPNGSVHKIRKRMAVSDSEGFERFVSVLASPGLD